MAEEVLQVFFSQTTLAEEDLQEILPLHRIATIIPCLNLTEQSVLLKSENTFSVAMRHSNPNISSCSVLGTEFN